MAMDHNVAAHEANAGRSTVSSPRKETTTTKEQHNRRIRENQQRSRAKRKQHFQELEAKLRQCQAQGVEATAEMQAAARKVAEENRKLRVLLSIRGVGDDVINEFLVSGNVPPARHHSFSGYLQHQPTSDSPAVLKMKRLMGAKRPRCLEPSEPFCAPPGPSPEYPMPADYTVVVKTRDSPTTTPSPTWEVPSERSGMSAPMALHQTQYQQLQQAQYALAPHPGTALSRVDAAVALTGLGQVTQDEQSPSAISSAPLPTPPYGYNMQPYASAPGYNQQQPSGPQLLLQSPVGPSSVTSNYLQTQPRGNNCSMATEITPEMTNPRGQIGYWQ